MQRPLEYHEPGGVPYHLHFTPLKDHERGNVRLESPWSDYVLAARNAYAARMQELQARWARYGIPVHVAGPVVIEDPAAEAKSPHGMWEVHIPEGHEADASRVVQQCVGSIVGPVRREARETVAPGERNGTPVLRLLNGRVPTFPEEPSAPSTAARAALCG